MKALSIQQPWAALILAGLKPVENRSWPTPVRGPILIHAGKKFDMHSYAWLLNNWHTHGLPAAVGDFLDAAQVRMRKGENPFPVGAIVGTADVVDCVTSHPSPFFNGPFGFVLANAKQVEPVKVRGMLGFFNVEWP